MSQGRRAPAGIEWQAGENIGCGHGAWTVTAIGGLAPQLAALAGGRPYLLDCHEIEAMDTAGALLLHRATRNLQQRGGELRLLGLRPEHQELLDLVAAQAAPLPEPPRPPGRLENEGRRAMARLMRMTGFLSFVGETTTIFVSLALRPRRIRWRAVLHHVQTAGWEALPIIGLLSLLIGVVVAYQGTTLLQRYGATLFVSDLVGLSVTREMAPLLTAIIVAGRTGSSYTAQIGTMVVSEEVDAITVLGVEPIEILVIPKIMALLLVLPLLTAFADALGIAGGMLMANAMVGLTPTAFWQELLTAVAPVSYLLGIGKSPVFALIIATVGCYQGLIVKGGAEGVGRQTTVCVVQAIFLIIIADAAFSVAFSGIGIPI